MPDNFKDLYELGFKSVILHDPGRFVAAAAVVLLLIQSASNWRTTERLEKEYENKLITQEKHSQFNVQKAEAARDASNAELAALRARLTADHAITAKRDSEWASIDAILGGHRALAPDDDPRFVSRVVNSAYRLREEVCELDKPGKLEDSVRLFLADLRWATTIFLGAVESIEYGMKIDLRERDVRIDDLKDRENAFRKAHDELRERINTLIRGAAYGRGKVNFASL